MLLNGIGTPQNVMLSAVRPRLVSLFVRAKFAVAFTLTLSLMSVSVSALKILPLFVNGVLFVRVDPTVTWYVLVAIADPAGIVPSDHESVLLRGSYVHVGVQLPATYVTWGGSTSVS